MIKIYNPIVFESSGSSSVTYDLFSRLLKDRIIFLSGEINQISSNIVVSCLLYLDSISHDDIYLYINSPGGEINQGLAIIDTMNFIKSDVSTIGMGLVASMASIILTSGTKKKRMCLKNTTLLIHQPLGGISGQASDIEITNKEIQNKKELLCKILAETTNTDLLKIKNDIDRDYYLTSREALDYGLIDEIL